jgi:hypothetical protein
MGRFDRNRGSSENRSPPPITEAQIDYLRILLHRAGWPDDPDLELIDELAGCTGWDELNEYLEELTIEEASELIEYFKEREA